jgi:lipopolysaccharide/colanic/teichoic acid biosynthesis glycosyltransferase
MMHKFRTMVDDAEQHTGPVWARSDDPRITSFGRLLRRFRLDELPQIWNVLRGDMSLVGPRPERPAFVEWLMQEFPYYHRRLLVRPGISGWAQVRGVYDRSLDDVRRKLKDDFFYIENMSLRLDLKILLITVWVVLSGKGH